jgi:Flavodoxin-like fold
MWRQQNDRCLLPLTPICKHFDMKSMTHILHIDASPRGDRSKSRKLAKGFMARWQDQHPDSVITYRDLRQTPVPHVTEDWIAAYFASPEALTSEMTPYRSRKSKRLFRVANCIVRRFIPFGHHHRFAITAHPLNQV